MSEVTDSRPRAGSVIKLEHSAEEPLNREPPLPDLIKSFLTTEGGYDRNHGPIPHIDADVHIVRVDGAVKNTLELTVKQLHELPQHEVVCALQCAGNRRHTMRTKLKEVSGIDWFDGAVMNCSWRGPLLRDVLQKAEITLSPGEGHVAFACHQTPCQDDEWYGGSIPLERAMREDAEMNGKPLTPEHGYPVRIITPGVAGARSVKWLDRITVQSQESPNYYQHHDYKILPPEATDMETAEKYWHTVSAIQDMPVNSVVGVPQSGDTVTRTPDGKVAVKGYALPSGENGPVTKVEVSGDGGKTWTEAELIKPVEGIGKWSWALWRGTVAVEPGKGRSILSRAVDSAGNTQEASPQWNLRGVAYNGYGEASDLTVV